MALNYYQAKMKAYVMYMKHVAIFKDMGIILVIVRAPSTKPELQLDPAPVHERARIVFRIPCLATRIFSTYLSAPFLTPALMGTSICHAALSCRAGSLASASPEKRRGCKENIMVLSKIKFHLLQDACKCAPAT